MADKEIPDMTDGGYVQAGDTLHIVRSGHSRKGALEARLPATRASSWGPASMEFAEDTDNGSNKGTLKAPASIAADFETTLGGGKGGSIASASTISIGGEHFYHVTGTTTITDIDFGRDVDGAWAWLEFDGALTLTHNATTLVLPGGANIVTTAGDRALVVQDNSDNVHVLAYVRAGVPPQPGPHFILEDQKAQNTSGGGFTSGADQVRDLNTEVYDPLGYVSLSSNRFTLAAGTWYISWSAPANFVDAHQTLLYNQTDSAVVARGSVEYNPTSGSGLSNRSFGSAVVTIAGSKAFEIRHRCATTKTGNGFGIAANFGTEVYTRVEGTKLA